MISPSNIDSSMLGWKHIIKQNILLVLPLENTLLFSSHYSPLALYGARRSLLHGYRMLAHAE